jgi:hypothetical protein
MCGPECPVESKCESRVIFSSPLKKTGFVVANWNSLCSSCKPLGFGEGLFIICTFVREQSRFLQNVNRLGGLGGLQLESLLLLLLLLLELLLLLLLEPLLLLLLLLEPLLLLLLLQKTPALLEPQQWAKLLPLLLQLPRLDELSSAVAFKCIESTAMDRQ